MEALQIAEDRDQLLMFECSGGESSRSAVEKQKGLYQNIQYFDGEIWFTSYKNTRKCPKLTAWHLEN